METERKRFAAIVNPASGRRDHLHAVRRLGKHLEDRGGHLDVLVSQSPGHPTALAADLPDDCDALVVVGGDGTLNEVINGLLPRRLPLLVWSSGTANLLGRGWGARNDMGYLVSTLLAGRACDLDVGRINGRYFHSVAGIGFDGACIERMRRSGHIAFGDFFWPVWRTFWSYGFPEIRIWLDQTLVFEGSGSLMIGNQPFYGPSLRAFPASDPADGMLDVCILPARHQLHLLRGAFLLVSGNHQGRAGFICSRARRIRVEAGKAVPSHVDGEWLARGDIEVETVPKALSVLASP